MESVLPRNRKRSPLVRKRSNEKARIAGENSRIADEKSACQRSSFSVYNLAQELVRIFLE